MALMSQKIKITLKNTLPTYILISIFTMFFLGPNSTMTSFSKFGNSFIQGMIFSLSFNLLYFVPQSIGIFTGLHMLRNGKSKEINHNKAKWFLRIPAPLAVLTTVGMILGYNSSGYFPEGTDLSKLYIMFVIIIMMNIIFSVIMTINIYTIMNTKLSTLKIKSKIELKD